MNVVDGYSHEPAIFFFISSWRSEPSVAFCTGTNDKYSWLVGGGKKDVSLLVLISYIVRCCC